MSKSRDLFTVAGIVVFGVLLIATNFADRFVTQLPQDAKIVSLDFDPDFRMIAAAEASAVGPRDGKFGLGRGATKREVAAWDGDISPDGTGLPMGSGDAINGEEVFAEHCAICHGDFAEGVDNWPELAGGLDTLADEDPVKTVGSYWPYLSTTWDYVKRSMPFGYAQSLSDDDVYAIVAYILYSNDIVDEDFILSNETFLDVEMPNKNGFIVDDRLTSESHFWNKKVCMSDCKSDVKITMRAAVLDVTPEDEKNEDSEDSAAVTTISNQVEEQSEALVEVVNLDSGLVEAGEKAFKKCKSCHQIGDGAKNKTGPHLNAIFGRKIGGIQGFKYSKIFKSMRDDGRVWDEESMTEFLASPKQYAKGTKMSFAGFKKEKDILSTIEYLKSFQSLN
jgi:cytochrome c